LLGKFRAQYERMMMPLGAVLARTGLTPNQITMISLLSSMLCCYIYRTYGLLWGALSILLVGFTDMLDGCLARATGKTTRFGGVLDHVLDRYAEFFIVLGIALGGYADWIWVFFAFFGMVMASYTRAKAESIGGLKSCTVGIAERQEKLLLIICGSIIAWMYVSMQRVIMNVSFIIVGVLSHITVIQRLSYTRRYAKT